MLLEFTIDKVISNEFSSEGLVRRNGVASLVNNDEGQILEGLDGSQVVSFVVVQNLSLAVGELVGVLPVQVLDPGSDSGSVDDNIIFTVVEEDGDILVQ